jgi:flagellin-like hook-associated protein FlgL
LDRQPQLHDVGGSYYINGTVYTAAEQSITLSAADGSNDRIDVLAVDTTGTLVKVNGTAAANPSQPDVDPATQLFLKFVIVPAGATAPVIAADEIVFEENDGVGEWTGAVLSGTSVVVNSTSEPDSGTVCIAGTSAGSSAAGVIRLNKGSTISVDTLDSLVIRFKSKTTSWGTGQVRIHLQNASGVRVGAFCRSRTVPMA